MSKERVLGYLPSGSIVYYKRLVVYKRVRTSYVNGKKVSQPIFVIWLEPFSYPKIVITPNRVYSVKIDENGVDVSYLKDYVEKFKPSELNVLGDLIHDMMHGYKFELADEKEGKLVIEVVERAEEKYRKVKGKDIQNFESTVLIPLFKALKRRR